MTPLSKWIEFSAVDGRVTDAARVSVEARLATVVYWLPLAARQVDDDPEKVHQLRVSTRRAIAAVKLYGDWLPRGPARWVKKRLKKIRRAAGAARDLDVLASRLREELGDDSHRLTALVAAKRTAAQSQIVAVADKCHEKFRLGRKIERLLEGISPRNAAAQARDGDFSSWAVERLQPVVERFLAVQPVETGDVAALHEFRIEGKRLRYTIELLAPAFGPSLREIQYPIVQQLQEMLGRVNDRVAAGKHLDELRDELSDPEQLALLVNLIEHQRAQLGEAIADYRSWWTAERSELLQRGLAELVGEGGPKGRSDPNGPTASRAEPQSTVVGEL